jgi:hypothetical protein
MEIEQRCHTTEGDGSRNALPDTALESRIILGACRLNRQNYCLRKREPNILGVYCDQGDDQTQHPASGPRMNRVADELLRSRHSARYWVEHEARVWETRPARGTFRLEGGLFRIWKPFPRFQRLS